MDHRNIQDRFFDQAQGYASPESDQAPLELDWEDLADFLEQEEGPWVIE